MDQISNHVLVCTGGGCIASGALEVSMPACRAQGAQARRRGGVIETGCLGPCVQGPVVLIYPDGVFYQNVQIEDVPEIVEEHLLKGRIVDRLVSHAPGTERTLAEMSDIEFFNRQVKIVLRNCGIIDPLKIEEYIARDGYQALAKVLTEMTPEEVIERGAAPAACAAAAAPASPPAASGSSPGSSRVGRQVHPLQRRRGRPRRLHGPHRAGRRPAQRHRGHGHRRLRHRRAARATSTSAPSIRWPSSGCSTPSTRPASCGLLGKNILGTRLRLRPRDPHGLRRLRLRRGDGPHDLDRGQPRRAAPPPAVPGRQGPVGQAERAQQRGDLRQHRAHHPQGRPVVRQHRHREEQGHQGLRPGRRRPEHRPGGSARSACRWAS